MATVFMTDPLTGRCAMYNEPVLSGAFDDPNSARNAPLNSPATNLASVRFHSDFDYYLIHSGPTTVNVTHAAVASASTVVSQLPTITRVGQIVKTNIPLVTHSLGYVPAYMIVSSAGIISPSSTIQVSTFGSRTVSPYATTTTVGLLDAGISSASSLAALNMTYQVIVFRAPIADSPYLIDYDPTTNSVILGKGKFRGALKALRRAKVGDTTPFSISLGRTVDIANGVSKTVLANGAAFTNPIYNGSFSGSPSVSCTVE